MKDVEERFWSKVEKTDSCWNWTAALSGGYGVIRINKKKVYAHRFAYEALVGDIPGGHQLDHICHNRQCVNPGHLRPVTQKQNNENHSGARRDSKSGVRGVSWFRPANLWIGQVNHDGKRVYCKYFKSIEEAEAAVIAKRNELFTHNDADRAADVIPSTV